MSNASVFKYFILLIFSSLTMSTLFAQKMEEGNKEQLIPDRFFEQEKLFPGTCIIKGKNSIKQLAITFDDGSSSISKKIIDILDNLFPGAIVLMHDFDPADNPDAGSTRDGMLKGVEQILIKCKRMGYEFVTIEELSN